MNRIRAMFTRGRTPSSAAPNSAAIPVPDYAAILAERDALQRERDGYKNAYETLNTEIGHLRMAVASGRPSQPKQPAAGRTYTPVFYYDGLWTDPAIIHNHDFMRDDRYLAALQAGEAVLVYDHKMYWRLHVSLWCAQRAATLPGDFVECGVWRGFHSTAIMTYLNWPKLRQAFFLFDTFDGMVDDLLTVKERENTDKISHLNRHFRDGYERARRHFHSFERVRLVKGAVPETLTYADIGAVSLLLLDMNCVNPEIAAAEYFWSKITPGGIILLDDYGMVSYEEQKLAFDTFADRNGTQVLALPTGQGLIMKP